MITYSNSLIEYYYILFERLTQGCKLFVYIFIYNIDSADKVKKTLKVHDFILKNIA